MLQSCTYVSFFITVLPCLLNTLFCFIQKSCQNRSDEHCNKKNGQCCNHVHIFFFITVLPSEPELQQQKQLSEDVTKTNAAEKHLKQDPSPAISITTTIATTGPSGIPSQRMSSGHVRDWLQKFANPGRSRINFSY